MQEALRLKERKAVDEVVAVSLGPQQVQVGTFVTAAVTAQHTVAYKQIQPSNTAHTSTLWVQHCLPAL